MMSPANCPPPPSSPVGCGVTCSGVVGFLALLAAPLLLAAAALLLAPGAAWAQGCGGTQNAISVDSTLTCSDGPHSQVRFVGQGTARITIIAPGGTATTISGTSTNPALGIVASDNTASGNYAIYVSARPPGGTGATGAVSLTGSGRGASLDMTGGSGSATIVVGSAATIGSSTSSIGRHGIRVRGGSGGVTITNAGTIYANFEGIDVGRNSTGTMTVTHTGAITSTSSTDSPGMLLQAQDTGPMLVTTSGDVTATTSNQRGIDMRAQGNGPITLTATGGTITSAEEGVYIESNGTGAVTIQGTDPGAGTQSGPTITSSASHGVRVHKSGAGATAGHISITTTGGSITAGTGTSHHGIHVQDHSGYTGNVTINNAADITANNGRGINVNRLGSGGVEVGNTGMIGSSTNSVGGEGIWVRRGGGSGNVTITNAGTIYAADAGVDAGWNGAGTMTVTHSGAITSTSSSDAPGMLLVTQGAGPMLVTTSGDVTATTSDQRGIDMRAEGNGAVTLTATDGTITSAAAGVYIRSEGTGAVTIRGTDPSAGTQSGPTITSSGNHGVHVHKSGSGATAGHISITTTGGSITAGTGTSHGIHVQDHSGHTGNVTINNAADITASNGLGINVNRLGSGGVEIGNTGMIGSSTNSVGGEGIRVRRGSGSGDVTITKTGTIYATNAGVDATWNGTGTMTVTHSGAITSTSAAGMLLVTQGAGPMLVTTSGNVTATASNQRGIHMRAEGNGPVTLTATGGTIMSAEEGVHIESRGTGAVTIRGTDPSAGTQSGPTITSSGSHGIHVRKTTAGATAGHISITTTGGSIAAGTGTSHGIHVQDHSDHTGNVTINNVADITANNGRGINVNRLGSGGVEIGNTGMIGSSTNSVGGEGIRIRGSGSGNGTITNAGTIYAADEGIDAGWNGAGTMTVTHSGAITASNGRGISVARQGTGSISVTVAEEATVTGDAGIYVSNAALGLVLAKRHTPPAVQVMPANENLDLDDDVILPNYRAQTVRVDGTVTGTSGHGVHLVGGGAVIVGRTGRVDGGAAASGIYATGGPVIARIDGRVTGTGSGSSGAIRLGAGGTVIIGPGGRVEQGDTPRAIDIRNAGAPGTPSVVLEVTGDTSVEGRITKEAAEAAVKRLVGPGGAEGEGQVYVENAPMGEGVILATADDGGYTGYMTAVGIDQYGASPTYLLILPEELSGIPSPEEGEQQPETQEEEEEGGCPSPGCVRVAEPEQPGPTQPEPEQPGPTQPEPEQPGPTQPEPEQPGPTQPEPEQPGPTQPEPEQPEPTPTPTEPPTRASKFCDNVALLSDARCRLYEALPSALLAMNGLPSRAERMSAVRDARGGWLRVEAAGGKWTADGSTRPDVAYDFRRHGMRAGMDFAMGETGLVGVSVHGLRGSAEMTRGGEFEVSGEGLGVNASVTAGDIHIDVQAAATRYEAELTSSEGTVLKDGAKGRGFALGVEAGRSVAMGGGVSLTPRLGLEWSRVSLEDFRDTRDATPVSMDDARSMRGRVGLTAETALGPDAASGRVYGSVDVEREFRRGTSVTVEDDLLETTGRSTGLRLGVGGSLGMGDGVVLRGGADWMTGGGGTNGFGGRLELNVRF